jgi:hypothetical protein
MTNVARQVYLHSIETELRRLDEYLLNIVHAEEEHQSAYETRCKQLETGCLVCGKSLVANDGISAAGYFARSSDGRVSGLIEEECFTNLVFRYFYGAKRSIEPHDPVWELFRESAQRSYFVLQRAPHTRNFYQQKLSFYRFDDNGVEISHKTIELQEFEKRLLSKERSDLFPLLERTLFDDKGRLDDSFLLLRKVSTDLPEEILYDQNFADFSAIMDKVSTQLP